MFSRPIAFLRELAARRRVAREVDEELAFHLANEVNRHTAEGVPPDEARRRALRDLGGFVQTAEEVRRVRTLRVEAFWFDVRDALRGLVRERGFTAVALLTLTLVVGANAAILSIADAVLFRPMPYANPDGVKILQVLDRKTGGRSTMTPYAFLDAIDRLDGVVSRAGLVEPGPQTTSDTPDGPAPVETATVSPGFFETLGIRPVRGRLFDAADAASGRAVLLSYAAWQNRFGGRDDVIGSTIKFRQSSFECIGVLPAGFVFPSLFVGKPGLVTQMPPRAVGAAGGTFHASVRISPAVSVTQAQAAIDAAVAPVAASMPNFSGQAIVLDDAREVLYGLVAAPIMRFLLASAALTLIIGCANLANMLLVRGERRTRETALRLALGANRGRLVRPIVAEALILGLAAAGAAVLVTAAGFDTLLRQVPRLAYGSAPVGVSLRVVAISIGLSLVGALIFAAVPAWRTAKADMRALLQGQARRRVTPRSWLGRPLVAVQIALALVAVFGAVVAARAFVDVLRTPLGFSPEGVVTISVAPPRPVSAASPSRVVSVSPDRIEVTNPPRPPDATPFYRRVLEALKENPDVVSVGAATSLPLGRSAPFTSASLPGVPPDRREGRLFVDYVLPGFFETLSMNPRSGRTLTWDDLTADPGALVISSCMASALFGGRDPLGQTLVERGTNRVLHVVGVVDDLRQSLERSEPGRSFALPAEGRGQQIVVARVRDVNDAALTRLKASVRAVAPDSLVIAKRWSDDIAGINLYRNPRFQTIVLGSLATLAVSLTAIGVFGVLNYLVVTRTRDMGVRLALGAPRTSLVRFVVGRAMIPVVIGLGAGAAIIALVRPLADAQLYHVNTHDPLTLALAALAVVIAALVAAYVPARRAASIDLVSVLRSE